MDIDFRYLLTIFTGLLYIIAVVPYFISLYKKAIQPHPVSWLLWSVIGFVNLLLYTQTGATYTQIIAYTSFFIPLVIFIFSFKSWTGGFSRLDYFCLAVSISALIFSYVYKSPILGLTLNILISDFMAFIPTIIKTFHNPKSENVSTWLITVIANVLTISLITVWTFSIALLPVYTLIMNGVVLALLFRRSKISQ